MGKIKRATKSQIIDIIMGIIMQVYFLFPWIHEGEMRYNTIIYLIRTIKMNDYIEIYKTTFLKGMKEFPDIIGTIAFWFLIAVIAFLVVQIMELIHVIVSIHGYYPKYLQVLTWACTMVILGIITTLGMSGYTIAGGRPVPSVPTYVLLYLLLFLVLEGIWILGRGAAEEWDVSSKRVKEEREQKKKYKKERKRRLQFPGRYSKLYYQILRKAFLHRWRDFSFLFSAVFLSVLFLFTGISMRNIFANSYGDDQGLLGLGLVEIMKDFLVVILLISLFFITVVLAFYRKKRMADIGVFMILGIRSDASFVSWIGELFAGLTVAVAGGLLTGRLFLQLFCTEMELTFPALGKLGKPSGLSYLGTVFAIVVICVFAFGFSHDIQSERQSADARGASVKSEKLPGRYRYVGLLTGGVLATYFIYRYAQRRTAESILVLSAFFVCLYVVVYNLWGIYLMHNQKKPESYIASLPEKHIIQHRYQTTARYVSLLAVIHISVLFYFCMKMVSNQIATGPEELFPYDYVLLANSKDGELLDEFVSGCHGKVLSFPMVRATTIDNTEMPDQPRKIIYQQGQNIGISETTYRELKRRAGETPRHDLDLDAAGEKIYIVYQQDQGSKAKPIDWYMGTKQPYLHIGQPLMEYNTFEYRNYYPQRTIAGEETSSLTGSFKQGKYENLVVFSDEYFGQVKDSFKTTNMYTGERLEEDEAVPEETIHEGPTSLVLICVPPEYQRKADDIVMQFQKRHAYDESFDPLVKSAYSKSEAVKRRQMEHLLEITINGAVIIMLLVVSLLLLHMKVKMELPEMQRRYQFMECFGMRRKERVRAEKKEISRFVWIPLGLSVCIVPVFTGIVFYLRGFSTEDMICYGIFAGAVCGGYVLIQALNLKFLQHMVIRKVEEDIEK